MKKGRKSGALKWIEEDNLIRLEGWARDGLTDKQIAENKIGVSEVTFCNWKKEYPLILEALKKGKAPVDIEVENATLKLALGYTVTVKKAMKVKTEKQLAGKGKIVEEHIEYVDEEIYIPPNPVNQIFWLKNRKPERWKDKPEIKDETALEKLDSILKAVQESAIQQKAE